MKKISFLVAFTIFASSSMFAQIKYRKKWDKSVDQTPVIDKIRNNLEVEIRIANSAFINQEESSRKSLILSPILMEVSSCITKPATNNSFGGTSCNVTKLDATQLQNLKLSNYNNSVTTEGEFTVYRTKIQGSEATNNKQFAFSLEIASQELQKLKPNIVINGSTPAGNSEPNASRFGGKSIKIFIVLDNLK